MFRLGIGLDSLKRGLTRLSHGLVALALLTASVSSASPLADSPKPASENQASDGVMFFEKNIRPILVEHCYCCHSAESKKVRGGLRLDSKAGLLKGGDLGPTITPGEPEKSLLIEAVRYKDESLQMPPKGKLSDQQIAHLSRWVAMGAPDPRAGEAGAVSSSSPSSSKQVGIKQGPQYWAFRPMSIPAIPAIKDNAWSRSPLDHFILAKLESLGLKPAPEADKRTLIRRATFDLTGLPPTPEEIAAFLADNSQEAFATVVDRLLASPRYGQRWGRHWLDVARYADSNGLDENTAYGNAWRYRDYVIAEINADKPFDQFVIEQLAGDLLPATGSKADIQRRLIATGFLSLGPKSLAEVDKKKLEMDIVDEQIDTVGRTFMGLTLGCARCHDHKFDPISAADYYGLAGIFQSTKTMDSLKTLAKWHEHSLATEPELAAQAAHEKKVKQQKEVIEKIVKEANAQLTAKGGKDFKLPAEPEASYPDATKAELKKQRDELASLEKAAPEMSSTLGVEEGSVADAKILVRGNHLTPGESVVRRFPTVLTSVNSAPAVAKEKSGRLELARWLVSGRHPLTARVMVNRVWRWHFGQGLVLSPDNFGTIGDRPVQPELLDWLAQAFVEKGWSLKSLHRLIMLSSTYRMSAAQDSKALKEDPENRFHWRWTPRRLEAEAVRDFLLATGQIIDWGQGGPVLHVKNREYLFDHTSIDKTKYDSRRRSVYLPVIRNNVYDVFQLFDFAEPTSMNGNRATTTIALQSLFMMNSDLVHEVARQMARRVLDHSSLDDAGRVRSLFEEAYGRPPTDAEITDALSFIKEYDTANREEEKDDSKRRLFAWHSYCQIVLASNEFIYIR